MSPIGIKYKCAICGIIVKEKDVCYWHGLEIYCSPPCSFKAHNKLKGERNGYSN